MNKTRYLALFALLFIGAVGCAPKIQTRGARSLLPQLTADAKEIWVYIDTGERDTTGVYRCRDVGEQVTCVKARVVVK